MNEEYLSQGDTREAWSPMPVLGKRKYGRKSYTTAKRFKARRRPRRGILGRIIRRVALRATETKYHERGGENVNLYHNAGTGPNFLQLTNMLNCGQGDSANTRTGDEVFGVGVALKLWLSNKPDRPNVMYRIIVYTSPVDSSGSPTVTDLMDTTGGGGNFMVSYANTEKYKIVVNRIVQPFGTDYSLEGGSSLKEVSKLVKIWIPLKKRRIQYHRGGSLVPKDQRNYMHLAVIPYDAFGTLLSDNIASVAINSRFYFKDP